MLGWQRCLILAAMLAFASSSSAAYLFTKLYDFKSTEIVDPAGGGPQGGVGIFNGLLYGTTFRGGAMAQGAFNTWFETGMIYKFDPITRVQTPLANLDATGKRPPNPWSNLVADPSGNLYGTTLEGGANGRGDLFMVSAATGSVSTLHTFDFQNPNPYGGVVPDNQGNLYGVASVGVYRVNVATKTMTTVATFSASTHGYESYGNLIRDSAGNLYGTHRFGGANSKGTIFKMDAATRALTTLVAFNGTNGAEPRGGLVADAGGKLYGTTYSGGAYNKGSIFQWDPATSSFNTLFSFDGSNGASPKCTLQINATGNLFGTTQDGTIFQFDATSRQLTTLFKLSYAEGANLMGALAFDSAGNLYGTGYTGGANRAGVIFQLSPIPEPTALSLCLAAVMLLQRYRR